MLLTTAQMTRVTGINFGRGFTATGGRRSMLIRHQFSGTIRRNPANPPARPYDVRLTSPPAQVDYERRFPINFR